MVIQLLAVRWKWNLFIPTTGVLGAELTSLLADAHPTALDSW